MPRTVRAPLRRFRYFDLIREIGCPEAFDKPRESRAFLALLGEASVRLLMYTLMPSHLAIVLPRMPTAIYRVDGPTTLDTRLLLRETLWPWR